MKSKKNIFIIILLLGVSIFTFYRLCRPGYFSMMDDMHVFRLQQFDQCLRDGQIPCRLISDGGMGYGYPLFNYYPPLSYSIAEFFHLFGFSFINSLKITFALCHLIGILGMYFFASIFWGKIGGAISAIIFLLAPYQATDSFVRGAIAESLAINLIPWVFYFLTKFINSQKNKYLLILSLTALLLSHNLISLAIAPVLLVYSIIVLLINKKLSFKSIKKLSIPVISAIGLSAFFLLPAIFEKNLVTVDTMTQGYFQYIIHFATLNQLFISRFWGYGASLWGPIDDMAFSIGLIQWILPLIIIFFLFLKKIFKNKASLFKGGSFDLSKQVGLIIFFFLVFLFSLFLTHNKSTFIWNFFSFMAYFQFPWRFLSIAIFAAAFISGSIIIFIKKKFQIITLIIITIITLILNINYFKEDIWYPNLTDSQKLSTENIIAQSGAGLNDYWPKYGQSSPSSFAPHQPFSNSEFTVDSFTKKSNQINADFTVFSQTNITIPVVYFPNWELYIDNQKTDFNLDPKLGLISFNLSPGNHHIFLSLNNTPIRTFANTISLSSFLFLIIFIIKSKLKNEK